MPSKNRPPSSSNNLNMVPSSDEDESHSSEETQEPRRSSSMCLTIGVVVNLVVACAVLVVLSFGFFQRTIITKESHVDSPPVATSIPSSRPVGTNMHGVELLELSLSAASIVDGQIRQPVGMGSRELGGYNLRYFHICNSSLFLICH